MCREKWLDFAMRILNLFVIAGGQALTVEAIAGNLTMDELDIWLVLDCLQESGMVRELGESEALLLARPADQITVLEVYAAIEADDFMSPPRKKVDAEMARKEAASRWKLAGQTVAEMSRLRQGVVVSRFHSLLR